MTIRCAQLNNTQVMLRGTFWIQLLHLPKVIVRKATLTAHTNEIGKGGTSNGKCVSRFMALVGFVRKSVWRLYCSNWKEEERIVRKLTCIGGLWQPANRKLWLKSTVFHCCIQSWGCRFRGAEKYKRSALSFSNLRLSHAWSSCEPQDWKQGKGQK